MRVILSCSTAGASTPSSKIGLEHCGWEPGMDCIDTIVKMQPSPGTRRVRAYPAARFRESWKTSWADFGLAPRREYPGSILRRKQLETTTCPMACRVMSSVRAHVHRAEMG